jgi:hypothetical protein
MTNEDRIKKFERRLKRYSNGYEGMAWSVRDKIETFYDELWKLHDTGALDSKDDDIAIKILNAIDDAFER